MGLGPRPGERPGFPQPGFSWPCADNKMEAARGKEKSGAGASELNGGCHAQGSGGRENKSKFGFDSRRRRGYGGQGVSPYRFWREDAAGGTPTDAVGTTALPGGGRIGACAAGATLHVGGRIRFPEACRRCWPGV